MNWLAMPRAKSRFMLALVLSPALLLAACDAASPPPEDPPLAGARLGGDFALTDTAGKTVRWQDFAGRYRIVYFGYAFCPDICPTDMARIGQGLRLFREDAPDRAKRVTPIFISVDPRRDTPARIAEFTASFDPGIVGLTGSPAALKAAADAFGVWFEVPEDAREGYLVGHTNIAYLFGPNGEPIATLPTDQGGAAVAAELEKWVR